MNQAAAEGEKPKGDNPALDALDAEAQRVDNGGEVPPGPEAAQPAPGEAKAGEHSISTARIVQGALLGAGALLAHRYPAARRVYTPDRCGLVGEALAPVLDRWGFAEKDSVAMQYCVAIGALMLLGMDTVAAIKSSTHENNAPPGAPAAKVVP